MAGVAMGRFAGPPTGVALERPAARRWVSGKALILYGLMAVVVMVVGGALYNPKAPAESVMVGLVAASFLLVFQSRIWLLLPIYLVQLTVQNYMLGVGQIGNAGLSIGLIVTVAATMIALPTLVRSASGLWAEAAFRRVFLPALGLILAATFANYIASETDYVMKNLRFQLTQIAPLVLIACLVRTRYELKQLAIGVLILGTISAVICFIQIWMPRLGRRLTISPLYEDWVLDERRAIGLSISAPGATYDLTFLLAALIGFIVAFGIIRLARPWTYLYASAAVLAFAVYLTVTRSGLIAIAAALGASAQFTSRRLRVAIFIVLVTCAALFQINPDAFGRRFDRGDDGLMTDKSAIGHQAMWQVSLALAIDNPILGVGSENWEEASMLYVGHVDIGRDDHLQEHAEGAVGNNSPHNDFLGYWGYYGIGGLLGLVGIFWGTVVNGLRAARAADPWIRGLAVGVIAGLAGYIGNALFHNVTTTTSYLWMYAGASVLLARWAPWTGGVRPGGAGVMWRPVPTRPGLPPRRPAPVRRAVRRAR